MSVTLSRRLENEKTELQGTIQQLQNTVDTLTRELASTDTELNKTKAALSDLVGRSRSVKVVLFFS